MGISEQWLACGPEGDEILEEARATRLSARRRADEWLLWRLPLSADLDDFESAVLSIAARAAAPALGVWIEDSDYALVVAAMPRGRGPVRVVLRASAAQDYAAGRRFVERLGHRPESLKELAEWARHAPHAASEADLTTARSSDSPLVEDSVIAMLDALQIGLPIEREEAVLQDLVMPIRGRMTVRGRTIDAEELPYEMGIGRGVDDVEFIGIWDRARPGPPVDRFPKDAWLEAQARLLELSGIGGRRRRRSGR